MKRKSPDLSDEEELNVRTALRFLHYRCGGWEALTKALGVTDGTLSKIANGERAVTPRLTFRIARFAKVGVDDILDGRFAPAGTCPHCGHCPKEPIQ
jgi:transcriptional regulator with XRE-family HTH domain